MAVSIWTGWRGERSDRCRGRDSLRGRRGGGGEEVGDELGVAALGGEEIVALGEAGGFDCGGDVEDVVALGDGEGLV